MVHSPGALLLHFVSGKSDQVQFRHDRMTGETIRINVASNGTASNSMADDDFYPSISIDGNRGVFSFNATNLVPNDKTVQ